MVDGVAVLDVAPERLPDDVDAKLLGGALMKSEGPRRIVVDLSRLDLISSQLLAKLITLDKRIQRGGGKLVLCGLHPFVRGTFASTKLDQILDICDEDVAALASQ